MADIHAIRRSPDVTGPAFVSGERVSGGPSGSSRGTSGAERANPRERARNDGAGDAGHVGGRRDSPRTRRSRCQDRHPTARSAV